MTPQNIGIDRRHFLAGTLGAGLMVAHPAFGATGGSTITILLNEPVGTVSPDLHGYLLENLGTAIYDGVWVGERSRIPNVNGIRKALLDHLRAIKASVIRWPGGNFADYYDWRDGIGPRAGRPRRTNAWSNEMPAQAPPGPQRYDPNQFGTHEFMDLCRLSGARPFLNINLRSMSPMEGADWVDYCNAPAGTTTLADLRRTNGSAAPFNVDYWGIGNEPWAWGGNMSASDYAGHYRRFVQGLPRHGRALKYVACGGPPSLTNADWTRTFLASCRSAWFPVPIHGMSVHYYTSFPPNEMRPGETIEQFFMASDARPRPLVEPLNYDESGWYSVLADSARIEGLIRANWEAVRAFDPRGTIRLYVDEWGGIFRFGTELSPEAIRSRVVTLRDALGAALTLDVFNRHCDKVVQACFTGLINQEGGLFRAEGDRFVATPIYHVFAMYADHQGGQSLRTVIEAPSIQAMHGGRTVSVSGLSGSASRTGNVVTLTIVNPHVSEAREAALSINGGRIESILATSLSSRDIRAQNTFEQPGNVVPVAGRAETVAGAASHVFPPASVTKLAIRIS